MIQIAAPNYIRNLITDRTQTDVYYIKALCAKGWQAMTADEKTYFLAANSRGAYNISDILRTNDAQTGLRSLFNNLPTTLADDFDIAVAEVLQSLKYNQEYYDLSDTVLDPTLKEVSYGFVTLAPVNANWHEDAYPAYFSDASNNVYDISYYLNNINILRQVLPITAPDTPDSLELLDYKKANDIERILVAIYNAYEEYKNEKEGAIWDAEDAEIDKQARAAKSWIWSGEVYAGEV